MSPLGPPSMSLQPSLLIKLNTVPADKAKILKGHRFIFTEQARILNYTKYARVSPNYSWDMAGKNQISTKLCFFRALVAVS